MCTINIRILWTLILLCSGFVYCRGRGRVDIRIGGIFYTNSTELIGVFRRTGEEALLNDTARLVPVVREVPYGDILAAGRHVCDLAAERVYGIIDGTSGRVSAHIQAVSDSLEMPHIIINHNDYQASSWSVLNLYPSAMTYNVLLRDLIERKEWGNFTIMYVRGHSMANVNTLLELANIMEPNSVTVRELHGDNYRQVFAAAKKRGNVNFLVDCPAGKLLQVLLHAQQVGLMSNRHSYIFTSPDLYTRDLDQFKHGGANITGFRLIDIEDKTVQRFCERNNLEPSRLSVAEALVYDATQVLAMAYEKLPVSPEQLSCNGSSTWRDGSSVLNYVRTNKLEGLTRRLVFDSTGQRKNFTLDIYELNPAFLSRIGTWRDELLIEREEIKIPPGDTDIMRNKTFKVLISLNPPYGYVKESFEGLTGNDRYEGFTIDIIDELSQKLGFSYIFEVEKVYGEYRNGKATGMIKKILDKDADFAICDFTITHERQAAIDFTTPFMSVGIGILYRKPSKQPPAMFSFMEVFSKQVWINMMLSQIGLAVVIIFVGRISHKEWHNPIPCVEEPESLDNQFSLANAVWLIIGSVMQQGSEIAPIALAPRMITSVWWFFTMVMISSYTGTLVAFLTVESKTLPFSTAEELAGQSYITYGAKKGGSTLQFFNQSDNKIYKKMFQTMIKKDYELCTSDPDGNTKGRIRVQNERYAFFMESASIEYETERQCDLMKVGDTLDTKNYGIGMLKNSSYREEMSNVILKMKESGTLQKLKDKWWKERRGGGACTDDDDGGDPKQLELKNMIGAFVVLGVGCIIGIFISILDMLWGVYKRTIKYNTAFRFELVEELRFALKFSGNTKPVRRAQGARPPSAAASGAGDGGDGGAAAVVEVERDEARDSLDSLHSVGSSRSGGSHCTRRSHGTHRSSRSMSLAFARRRRYS